MVRTRLIASGFTLVEVLVVVAIIALVAAILFPVLASARREAKRPVCTSNLRQIAVACDIYAADADQRYPRAVDGVTADSRCGGIEPLKGYPTLPAALGSYVHDKGVWKCPADDGIPLGRDTEKAECMAPGTSPTVFAQFASSFGYRNELGLLSVTAPAAGRWSNGAEAGPSDIALAWDIYGSWHGGTAAEDKRFNTVFCDDHVAMTKPLEWNRAQQMAF